MSFSQANSRGRLLRFLSDNLGQEVEAGTAASAGSFVALDADQNMVLATPAGGGGGISWYGSTANGIATYKDADEATVEANLTFDGSTLTVAGDTSITGDTTLGNASSDTVTFNAKNIVLTNVGLMGGTDDTVLVYNGSSIVTDEIDSKVWAGDLVDYTGTPVNNQVAIWTDTDTLEGVSDLTYDGSTLLLSDAAAKLQVMDTSLNHAITLLPGNGPKIQFGDTDSSDASFMEIGAYSSINNIDTQARDFHLYGTNTTAGFYFDESAGNFGIGTTAPTDLLTVATDASAEAVVSVTQYNNSSVTDGPNILLKRARGTMASPTIVLDGDTIGSLRWYAYDGTDWASISAGIMAEVDGTPGANDTPGRLLFRTAADGSNSLTERMRIDSAGLVTIAGDLVVGGGPGGNSTGVRAEFLADAASYTNFGAYWETCGASNANADTILKAVNSNNGQLYDMLGPATSTSNIYWYSCTAVGSGGTAVTERATDSLYANPFTGQHTCEPIDDDVTNNRADHVGLIVCSTGEYKRFDRCKREWMTGKEGITINEALPRVALSSTSNDKSVFGVISNRPNQPVQNTETGEWEEDDDGVAIGFSDILSNQVRVNSLGEGAIWVCNVSGNLENGDYITTCEIPGYGMIQDDGLLHNYTVAKITQDCDFNLSSSTYTCEEFEFSGSTHRKAFVGCTYHCG